MDMVCVKTPESTHDFSHDPIEIYVDDKGDIRAKDTTLGADDGYGVAYMLAVMEEDFPHPPLELVFTVQEENGCNGVDALDAGKLKSRRMIGLDVMGETVEYTSCVSCFTSDLMKLTKTCETEPAKGAALMLTVSGVQPVHAAQWCTRSSLMRLRSRRVCFMRFPKTARRTDFPPWRAAKRKTMRRWRRKQ